MWAFLGAGYVLHEDSTAPPRTGLLCSRHQTEAECWAPMAIGGLSIHQYSAKCGKLTGRIGQIIETGCNNWRIRANPNIKPAGTTTKTSREQNKTTRRRQDAPVNRKRDLIGTHSATRKYCTQSHRASAIFGRASNIIGDANTEHDAYHASPGQWGNGSTHHGHGGNTD